MRFKLTPAWQAFVDANPELLFFTVTISALQDRLSAVREEDRDRGALSVEQALITAGLFTIGVALVAGIAVVVKKYQSKIQ